MNNQLELYDIYGHWHVPFWQTSWFRYGILAAIVLAICLLVLFLFLRWYKKKSLSPVQQALLALDDLKNKKIVSREDAHDAYFSLTSILKTFFQLHFGQPFEGMSDAEMIAQLKRGLFSADQVQELDQIVNASLGVKYAHEQALHEEVMRAILVSRALVKQLVTGQNR